MAKKRDPGLPKEVFISHSTRNARFVGRLVKVLRSHGIPVWFSTTNIRGAQQWHDEIGAALDRCDWFLVVLSKESVRSEWVKRELMRALNDRKYRRRILPVRFRDCDLNKLSWTLEQMQIIDCSVDEAEGFAELLRTWGLGYDA